MQIVVCVKQVYDPKTVRISRSREELDLREAVKTTNVPDKFALEAVLRLREVAGGEVIALTVGDLGAEDTVREAVAMGADRGLLMTGLGPVASGRATAAAIAAAVRRLGAVDLVLTGQAGLVDGTGSLAPRIAAVLGWPVILDTVALALEGGDTLAAVVLSGDAAVRVPLALPAVAAIQPGAERPRYPQPARIAKAWSDGLVETIDVSDLGLDAGMLAPDIEPGGLVLPSERVCGQAIGGAIQDAAGQLVGILQAKRVV